MIYKIKVKDLEVGMFFIMSGIKYQVIDKKDRFISFCQWYDEYEGVYGRVDQFLINSETEVYYLGAEDE